MRARHATEPGLCQARVLPGDDPCRGGAWGHAVVPVREAGGKSCPGTAFRAGSSTLT
ncbi:protein of unknown function [Rhodovastum atsumiense]|nr:protein of unknown function [Rhodovastum atsumiense]